MPRNGSGTYSLAESPFVSNTTISSTAMNSDLADIASALTGSLARDGQGGMTDKLSFVASGWNYTTDLTTGMYRYSSATQRIKSAGVDIVEISASGLDVLSGSLMVGGASLLPVGLGPLPWAGTTAPDLWLFCYGQSLLRADYADLFTAISTTYGAADGTHFSLPDCRGRIPFGKDNMGGTAAGRLTTAGGGVDGLTLGAVGGSQSHTNVVAEMVDHTHGYTSPTGATGVTAGGASNVVTSTVGSNTGSVNGGASSIPFSIVNPAIVTNYIIYAGV